MNIPPPPNPPLLRSYSTPIQQQEFGGHVIGHVGGSMSRTPPLTPKRSGKMITLRIVLLDETITVIQAQVSG